MSIGSIHAVSGITKLATAGDIQKITGVAMHRVQYVIKSRGVKPCALAGRSKIFDSAGIEQIVAGLKEAATPKAGLGLRA